MQSEILERTEQPALQRVPEPQFHCDVIVEVVQDILGIGNEGRMNLPGSSSGNWMWRMKPGALTATDAERLREMVTLYER